MKERRKKSPARTSALPTTDVTASVWIGCTAKTRLEINAGLFSPWKTCPESRVNRRVTSAWRRTLTKWYPQAWSPWNQKLTRKESTVRGRYDLWLPEWVRGVPQKSFWKRDERGLDQRRSWFPSMARLCRQGKRSHESEDLENAGKEWEWILSGLCTLSFSSFSSCVVGMLSANVLATWLQSPLSLMIMMMTMTLQWTQRNKRACRETRALSCQCQSFISRDDDKSTGDVTGQMLLHVGS